MMVRTANAIKGYPEEKSSAVCAALRGIGNVLSGSDEYATILYRMGLLPVLESGLLHKSKAFRKETLWSLSNLALCKNEIPNEIASNHTVKILNVNPCLQIVMEMLLMMKANDTELKKEASICISNLIGSLSTEQIESFVFDYHVLEVLVDVVRFE